MLGDGIARPLMAFSDLAEGEGSAGKCDPAVSLGEQRCSTANRPPRTSLTPTEQRFASLGPAVNEDDGSATARDLRRSAGRSRRHRCDEDAQDAQLLEHLEVPELSFAVLAELQSINIELLSSVRIPRHGRRR